MKSLIIVLMITFTIVFSSCGKKDEVKKDEVKKDEVKKEEVKDDAFKDLRYAADMSIDDWSIANSLDKTSGTNFVGSAFTLSININEKDSSLYDICKDKFKDKFPMKVDVEPNSKSNQAMVLLPNYITVNVRGMGTTSGGLKEYDNPEMLKKLLSLFDLDGLSKLPMENLKGNDLVKFMPKFDVKK